MRPPVIQKGYAGGLVLLFINSSVVDYAFLEQFIS